MNGQFLFWRGKGEALGMFTGLTSMISSRRILGGRSPGFPIHAATPAGKVQFVHLSPRTGNPGLEKPNRLAKTRVKFVLRLAKTGVSDESPRNVEFSLPKDGGGRDPSTRKPAAAGKQRKYK